MWIRSQERKDGEAQITRLLWRRKATEENSEREQKGVAKCYRKANWIDKTAEGVCWGELKGKQNTWDSLKQKKAIRENKISTGLVNIQTSRYPLWESKEWCVREDFICPSRRNQYLCKSWKMKSKLIMIQNQCLTFCILNGELWKQGLYLSGSF